MSLHEVSSTELLLVQENKKQLEWLDKLLSTIRPQDYSSSQLDSGISPISSHVRHVLNHYDLFLQACQVTAQNQNLNYEARIRSHPAEQSISAAKSWLSTIYAKMTDSDFNQNSPLILKECDGEVEVSSSVGREMAFLYSHTAHHLALIKQQAIQLGYDLAESFGVHPSTLRAQGKACAR